MNTPHMNGSLHGGAAVTRVHVEVRGSLDIPLHLGLLANLADPLIEQEVVREAARIAVSERLGCFDGVRVRISSSGGREGSAEVPRPPQRGGDADLRREEEHMAAPPPPPRPAVLNGHKGQRSDTSRHCEADVDLIELGHCIESIQRAYEGLLAQAHLLHELLNADTVTTSAAGDGGGSAAAATLRATLGQQQQQQPLTTSTVPADAVERLAEARKIVAAMVADHRADIVAEAAAAAVGEAMPPTTATAGVAAEAHRRAAHEADMFVEEQAEAGARTGGWPTRCGSARAADPYVDSDVDGGGDVDAGLRFALLAEDGDDDEEEEGEEERRLQLLSQPSPDEEEEDLVSLNARYRDLGYTPL